MSTESLAAAARDVIRLALGRPISNDPNWLEIVEVARAERLLGIAWVRSGAVLRERAPSGITAAWRAIAVEQDSRARVQLETLLELNEILALRGVASTVLKGPALSVWLYGEPGARMSVDLDLLIREEDRQLARQVLQATGWTRWLGHSPWDECFYRRRGNSTEYLEVHSRLPGEALAHCGPLRLESQTFGWAARELQVAWGHAFTVYLAANMAKHGVLPLSAISDFHTHWTRLPSAERDAVHDVARSVRLSGCIRWALSRTRELVDAAEGHPEALQQLGFAANGRIFRHAYIRLARLADNPVDAARVAAAWMWPRSSRRSFRGFAAVWGRRLRKKSRGGLFLQAYGAR